MIQFDLIRAHDPELCGYMEEELARQRSHLELIASENFVSETVMAAMGSHLTNKYAEGYPGKRYYGGCECVDKVEDLARDQKALWCGTCKCPAPFRRTGEPFRLFCAS